MVSLNRSRDGYKYLLYAGFLAVAVLNGSLKGLDGWAVYTDPVRVGFGSGLTAFILG
jgi:rhodanese-related sulfurtransferase